MKFEKAQEFALTQLRNELPKTLYYHCYEHTVDVIEAAERLGRSELLSEENLLLLKTAAAFHDVGFVSVYKDHEEKGCEMAREVLPGYGYNVMQIDQICGMIMATKIPQTPGTKLQEMICDADLDYLGRDDFYTIGDRLFQELKTYGILETEEAWNRLQVKFLTAHQYFTTFSKENRESKKQDYLKELITLVKTYE